MKIFARVLGIIVIIGLLLGGALFVRIGFHKQIQMFLPPRLDTSPPELPAAFSAPAILVFSKTNGFRHHEAIPAANRELGRIAGVNGWEIYTTENGAVFTSELLSRFGVVVWNSVSGRVLRDEQRVALRRFIESGGGFVALHAAGDGSHESWPWFVSEVIRAEYTAHPRRSHIQQANILIDDRNHPATRHLDNTWTRSDEWYSFSAGPREPVHVLARLDESSYDPEQYAMGANHPIIWSHELQKGRIFFSALGHTAESWVETDHLTLITNAIGWAGRLNEVVNE